MGTSGVKNALTIWWKKKERKKLSKDGERELKFQSAISEHTNKKCSIDVDFPGAKLIFQRSDDDDDNNDDKI